MRPIRLLLVDDQPMTRSGLRTMLGAEPDLEIVAEAGDGAEAVDLARRLQPDVVLMELRLPRLDGVAATRAVGVALPGVRVLVLTDDDRDESVEAALRAGAYGYLSKKVGARDLAAAVRTVAAGGVVLDPALVRGLLDRSPAATPTNETFMAAAPDGLTTREREVLVHLARGLNNGEIADRLQVSETTVKTHVGNLLTKLNLRDRVQAVVYAYDRGLVRPQGPEMQMRSTSTVFPEGSR